MALPPPSPRSDDASPPRASREPSTPRDALVEALVASALVTVAVTVCSVTLPSRFVATAVGLVFLGATWWLVWRKDDAAVVRAGLSLGGLVLPGKLDTRALAAASGRAVGWAFLAAALTFGLFFIGWRAWWGATGVPSLRMPLRELGEEMLGQLVLVALPEEAFYRGYLQSRLDDAFPARVRILGADVGPSVLVTSAVFALGHVATIHAPTRLAVFFPSLLFGWLRARTGGIGASSVFHAACNVFSLLLGRAYGVY